MRTFRTLALLLACAGVALAGPTPEQKCTASKMKASGKNALSDAKCLGKASKAGTAVDMECLDKSSTTIVVAFGKAESKGGCLTLGDAAAIGDIVDGLTTFAEASLGDDGSPASMKCASSRRTAAGKYVSAVLGCHAKAALIGMPPDSECLAKAQDKLSVAFDKSEGSAGSNCDTAADAPATQTAMDGIVAGVVAALAGGGTTTTTTVSTTTTTTNIGAPVSFATDVQPIFTGNCIACHSGPFPPQGLDLSAGAAYGQLVNVSSVECPATKRVDPGSAGTSYLYHKIIGSGPCFSGGQMPLFGAPLSPAQQLTIATWIAQGALNN